MANDVYRHILLPLREIAINWFLNVLYIYAIFTNIINCQVLLTAPLVDCRALSIQVLF